MVDTEAGEVFVKICVELNDVRELEASKENLGKLSLSICKTAVGRLRGSISSYTVLSSLLILVNLDLIFVVNFSFISFDVLLQKKIIHLNNCLNVLNKTLKKLV